MLPTIRAPSTDFDLVKPFGVSGRVTTVVDGSDGGARIEGSDQERARQRVVAAVRARPEGHLVPRRSRRSGGQRFKTKYQKLDGAPGEPVSGTYTVPRGWNKPRGWAQDFEKGRMTRNKATGNTVWQWGPVLKKYDNVGREGGALGLPKTGVWRGSGLQGGDLPEGPDHLVDEARRPYASGARSSRPISAAVGPAAPSASRPPKARARARFPAAAQANFANGTLYLAYQGRHRIRVWGRIDDRYKAIGGAKSDCGYPTADQEQKAGLLEGHLRQGRDHLDRGHRRRRQVRIKRLSTPLPLT